MQADLAEVKKSLVLGFSEVLDQCRVALALICNCDAAERWFHRRDACAWGFYFSAQPAVGLVTGRGSRTVSESILFKTSTPTAFEP